MSDERQSLFETLVPPSGGLAGLRGRIERSRRRRLLIRRAEACVAALLVVTLATWVAVRWPREAPPPPELERMRLSLGQSPRPSEPLTIPRDRAGEFAVHRVPLANDEVVFYLVASIHE